MSWHRKPMRPPDCVTFWISAKPKPPTHLNTLTSMKSPVVVFSLMLAFTNPALLAHEGHSHGDPEKGAPSSEQSESKADSETVKRHYKDHEGETVEKDVPTDVKQLWAKIFEEQAQLTQIIQDKNVEAVHDSTETLNLYLRKLPEISDMLDVASRDKVAAQVNTTTAIVDKIHHVGDQGGFQDAAAQIPTLGKMLTLLSKQYPPELIKPSDS